MPIEAQNPDVSDERPESDRDGAPMSGQEIEQLFREHNEGLLRFIHARVRSWSEAKDIAQEAYVKLLGLNSRRAVSYWQAYLYRTARNLAMDRMRQREVRDRYEHIMFFDEHDRESLIPSAEAESIERQELEHLDRAVADLPGRCRLIFTLVAFQHQPVDAVAELLKIKPDSVRQQLHRAQEFLIGRLRSQLEHTRESK
jgi:RNA polymerase sigma factor (sigma-70 family)